MKKCAVTLVDKLVIIQEKTVIILFRDMIIAPVTLIVRKKMQLLSPF